MFICSLYSPTKALHSPLNNALKPKNEGALIH